MTDGNVFGNVPRMTNQLFSDRDLEFLLYEVLGASSLTQLPHFSEHSRETFDAYIDVCRRFSRDVLWPTYRPIDQQPPVFEGGRIFVHPKLKEIWPAFKDLGIIAAARPFDVGGSQLPFMIATAANLYIMAANLSIYSYAGLTVGAGHLIEAFANDSIKARYIPPMYEGRFTGTMALTEPQAGSSLSDVQTRAVPHGDHFLLSGSKIFISAGDHDLSDNIVHMVLARIEGAPPGIKGVSLFVVPKFREDDGKLVDNDVNVAGVIHKIGWRGLPSLALNFGESNSCHGWLVGQPNRGISYMFQMMNEARIMVGANGVATASVAYFESLEYARTRPQGRIMTSKDPTQPQIPIIEHADVRRMLLRQKAIIEGGASLVLRTAKLVDVVENSEEESKQRAQLLLDLLTPITKSFPAEKGFESNALALQIHGGYGYSSEYLPEAWLRDQKLNTIHEGTTGIHGLDLLGRKVVAQGGAALMILQEEITEVCEQAKKVGVDETWIHDVQATGEKIVALTMELGGRGLNGDVEGMMRHSADYLELFSIYVIAWQWLAQATAAKRGLDASKDNFYQAKLLTAQYWLKTELPKIDALIALCQQNEDSFSQMKPDWF
jgi:alkylation response protein AidB-like acyl-CoA dehydrogenase